MSNTLHTAGSSKLFYLVTAQRNTFHNSSMSVLILSIPDSFTAGVVMNTKGQEANRICGQHCTNMESAGSLFLSYTFIAYLVDCTKLQRTTRWAGAKKDGKGGGWKLLGSGVRGGDRQDLIKDGLCYVISSKRRRPRCCRDGEQLAWGCLIACSDSFQASSSGARARYGTDVYCWVSRRRLHGNHCCVPVTPFPHGTAI